MQIQRPVPELMRLGVLFSIALLVGSGLAFQRINRDATGYGGENSAAGAYGAGAYHALSYGGITYGGAPTSAISYRGIQYRGISYRGITYRKTSGRP